MDSIRSPRKRDFCEDYNRVSQNLLGRLKTLEPRPPLRTYSSYDIPATEAVAMDRITNEKEDIESYSIPWMNAKEKEGHEPPTIPINYLRASVRVNPDCNDRYMHRTLNSPSICSEGTDLEEDGLREGISVHDIEQKRVEDLPETARLLSKASHFNGGIDLSHLKLGDRRVAVVTFGMINMSDNQRILSLNLRDNRITDRGMVTIVQNLSRSLINISELDLSYNKLGLSGAESLGRYLQTLPVLCRLDVSQMGMGDSVATRFFSTLAGVSHKGASSIPGNISSSVTSEVDFRRQPLRTLRVASNKITAVGAAALSEYLSGFGRGLAELDVSWNELRTEGLMHLHRAISKHSSLTSLDVSWNSLSHHDAALGLRATKQVKPSITRLPSFKEKTAKNVEYQSAFLLASLLETNSSLLHLNIEQNMFCQEECTIIGQALKENHTLLGLHIKGNSGRVDNYGFLMADSTEWPLEAAHSSSQIVKDVVPPSNRRNSASSLQCSNRTSDRSRDICWVCDKWVEVEFVYQLSDDDMVKLNAVIKEGEEYAKSLGSSVAIQKQKVSEKFFDGWEPERMLLYNLNNEKTKAGYDADDVYRTLEYRKANMESSVATTVTPFRPSVPAPSGHHAINRTISDTIPHSRQTVHLSPKSTRKLSLPAAPSDRRRNNNAAIIRRRRSGFIENEVAHSYPVIEKTRPIAIEKTLSFAYDSESDDELGVANSHEVTRSVLLSYESGNISEALEESASDDETDKSRRLTSDMMARLSGVRGMKSVSLLNANRRYDLGPTSQRDARDGMHEKGSIDAESGRPVYRLRRMVPPGRHTYVFSVGTAPAPQGNEDDEEDEFFRYDHNQPHNDTNTALSLADVEAARIKGVVLPDCVNVLVLFPRDSVIGNSRSSVPAALSLAEKLHSSKSAKPRVCHKAVLRQHQMPWDKRDGIMYSQYLFHAEQYMKKCFLSDWRYSKSCKVFAKDIDEENSIKRALWMNYGLLLEVYLCYSALYSMDPSMGLQGCAYNAFIDDCFILHPAGQEMSRPDSRRRVSDIISGSTQRVTVQNSQRTVSLKTPESNASRIQVQTGFERVVSHNPRGTHVVTSPRASVLLKQIANAVTFVQVKRRNSIQQKNCKATTMDAMDTVTEDSCIDDLVDGAEELNEIHHFDEDLPSGIDSSRLVSDLVNPAEHSATDLDANEGRSDGNMAYKGSSAASALSSFQPSAQFSSSINNGNGTCSRAEVDMVFISNCATGPRVEWNNKRYLTRFQFIDAIVSLACLKFIQSGICGGVPEAIFRLCTDNIEVYAESVGNELFVNGILSCKSVHRIVKQYFRDLERIFRCYTHGEAVPLNTSQRTMSVNKWFLLVRDNNIEINERDGKLCFYMANVQDSIDILHPKSDTKHLSFMEFVESMVRIAYMKRRSELELDDDEESGGLTSASVAKILEKIILAIMKSRGWV